MSSLSAITWLSTTAFIVVQLPPVPTRNQARRSEHFVLFRGESNIADQSSVGDFMIGAPVLTPHGLLVLRPEGDAPALEPERAARLEKAFARGAGHGLLALGADEVGTVLPPAFAYWRDLGTRYVTALCALPEIAEASTKPAVPIPADGDLDRMAAAAPPMTGAEYLAPTILDDLWRRLDGAFDAELSEAAVT